MPRRFLALLTISWVITSCAAPLPAPDTLHPRATATVAQSACAPITYADVAANGVFSPDHRWIVGATQAGTAVFDVASKTLRYCLDRGSSPEPTFTFSADSTVLLVARTAGYPITLWQLTPDLKLLFSASSGLVMGVALSPDKQRIAVLSDDIHASHNFGTNPLQVWEVGSGKLVFQSQAFGLGQFTADSRSIQIVVCTKLSTLCYGTEERLLPIGP